MTTIRWRGDAPAVAQVTTATPENVEVGDIFTLTLNGKDVSFTATEATSGSVVAGLVAAWDDATHPECMEVEATGTSADAAVTLTALIAGVPFFVTGSTVNGSAADTQSLTITATTPSQGPCHWDTAANWSTAAIPATGDDVYIEDSDDSILYGLDQSSVVLSSLNIPSGFTGQIGLPSENTEGATSYAEYRQRYLAIGSTTVEIGRGQSTGSGRIQLDTGTGQTAITVYDTDTPIEADIPSFTWVGIHASSEINVTSGSVGIATEGGTTATLSQLRLAGGTVRVGGGTTVALVDRAGGGSLLLETGAATLDQSSGNTIVLGSGSFGNIYLGGGTIDYRSSGTITDIEIDGAQASIDFSNDLRPHTVTDCSLVEGSILDPHETVTWAGGIQPSARISAP